MKYGKKGHHHTGKIDVHHLPPHPGADGDADDTYHANNKKHGMHQDGSGDNCSYGSTRGPSGDTSMSGVRGKGKTLNGGEGMAKNAKPSF